MTIHMMRGRFGFAAVGRLRERPPRDVVVLGASAGGVEALRSVVAGLPPDLPAAVFVVLHRPRDRESHLARILDRAGPLPAGPAEAGEPIRPGRIYVAPPDPDLLLESDRIALRRGPGGRWRPSVDALFASAAASCGPRVAGVVLTGYLADGAAGLFAIGAAGGATLAQDLAEAAAPDTPLNAMEATAVDYVLPLAAIPPVLAWLAERAPGAPRAPPAA